MVKIITFNTLIELNAPDNLKIAFMECFPYGAELTTACLTFLKKDYKFSLWLLSNLDKRYMTTKIEIVKLKFALWLLKDEKWGIINIIDPKLKDIIEYLNNVANLIQNELDGKKISQEQWDVFFQDGINLGRNCSFMLRNIIYTATFSQKDLLRATNAASSFLNVYGSLPWENIEPSQRDKLLKLLKQ